ncbi:MAG TPA: hypothetical protein VF048_14175, partial [Gemmatimonadaceae bacterium]
MDRRRFLLRSAQSAAAFGVLRTLPACAPRDGDGGGAASDGTSSPAFATLRDAYFVRMLALNPVTATYLGGDGYAPELVGVNARLHDYRPEAVAEEVRYLRDTRAALDGMDASVLPQRDRIDHRLMTAQTGYLLRLLDERKHHQR